MKFYTLGFVISILLFLLLGLVSYELITKVQLNLAYVALVDVIFHPEESNTRLIKTVQTHLQSASDNWQAQSGLGVLAQSLGERKLGVLYFQKASAIAPNNQIPAYHLGAAWEEEGEHTRALEAWRMADAELSFTSEGDYYLENDELLLARDKYSYALDINPTWAPAQEGLGKVLHKLYWRYKGKKPDQAISFLEEAIAIAPDPRDYIVLGDYARHHDDKEVARSRYFQGLEIFPGNANLNQRMGWLALQEGKLVEAEVFMKRAVTLDPEYAYAHQILGVILTRQGELDSAEQALQESLRLNPKAAWVYARLGDVNAAQGRIDNARMLYQQALTISPGLNYAKRRLQELKSEHPQ